VQLISLRVVASTSPTEERVPAKGKPQGLPFLSTCG
jgi:hypothetical protein